jgi:uncharacterized membrane protein YfcA
MDLLADHWHLIGGGGFVIGFLIGITGVGAGSLTTPLLIGIGFTPTIAVGTDLLFASITKASAAWRHHRLRNVDWPILGCLALGSLPGAATMLGLLYVTKADTHVLAIYIRQVLAVMLVVSAFAIALHPWLRRQQPPDAHAAVHVPPRTLPTLLFGAVLGMLVTLTSVGAGAIGVAVLTGLYPALLARRIVGTDIVHAIPLLAGSVPGILIGSRITGLIPDWMLRITLGLVLLWAAYLLWFKTT